MRIARLESEPFYEIPYQRARSGGGTESVTLPLLRGFVDVMPPNVDSIVVASDLQGVAPIQEMNGAVGLLGVALCEELLYLSEQGALPHPSRVGVILAGDLFSESLANRRGASGDVRDVYRALGREFRWVVGVMGNHDTLGPQDREVDRFCRQAKVSILDGRVTELDGLRVGGIGGIIGENGKPQRKSEKVFRSMMRSLLDESPSVVLLHGGPNVPGTRLLGSEVVRESLTHPVERLVICGHAHWSTALVPLPGVGQVLNVDARVVVLSAES